MPENVFPNLPIPTPPADPSEQAWNVESLIGSRVLLGAGLISLLAGIAFFIKLTHNPELRVTCGLALGLALMLGGTYVLAKRRTLVAEGVTGLGASALYLSLWGAYGPFGLIDARLAFCAMIAVSGTLALIAWSRKSENVALAGVIGGALTPSLLVAGGFDRITLAAYLAVLLGSMLLLAARCCYRRLEIASFAAVLCYAREFAPSEVVGGPPWSATQSIVVASMFFVQFAAALFFSARREGAIDRLRLAVLGVEVLAYGAVLELELSWNGHALAIADAAFAAVLLAAVATRVPKIMRAAYAILGLSVLTRAVEAWGGGHALTATLALEGAALVFTGIRSGDVRLRTAGYAALGLGAIGAAAALETDAVTHAIFNLRTFSVATLVLAIVAMLRDFATHRPALTQVERGAIQPLGVIGATAFTLFALSADVVTATAGQGDWTMTTQAALSVLWSLLATGLIAAGFRLRSPFTRYLGMGLFAATIAKVFVVDLTALDAMARVISALAVGATLVGVAAVYQIVMLRGKRAS